MRCHWNISAIRQEEHERFLRDAGCDVHGWDCLRELDIDTLARVSNGYYHLFAPTIDGDLIRKHPAGLWHDGAFIRVPLLMGSECVCGRADGSESRRGHGLCAWTRE
jgi:hypothetical protein